MADDKRAPAGGAFLFEHLAAAEVQTPERFDDDLRMFASTAEQFVEREYQPIREQIEGLDYEASRKLMAKAGELGLLSLDIPEEYGGLAQSSTAAMLVTEKLAQTGSFNV